MNTPDLMPHEIAANAPPKIPYVARTRKQIQAAEQADQAAVLARWKAMLPDARLLWPKVPAEDLQQVKGNLNRLAGMVQLRYRLNREDADQQVKAFVDSHP